MGSRLHSSCSRWSFRGPQPRDPRRRRVRLGQTLRRTDLGTEPEAAFSWSVGDRFDGTPSSKWTFQLRAADDSVVLSQQFAHCADGLSGLRVGAEADPAHAADYVRKRTQDLYKAMTLTLARMKEVSEATSA